MKVKRNGKIKVVLDCNDCINLFDIECNHYNKCCDTIDMFICLESSNYPCSECPATIESHKTCPNEATKD